MTSRATTMPWRHRLWLAASIGSSVGWIAWRLAGMTAPSPWSALLPGLAICGAAFLLCWSAELAELDLSQALALAGIALMTVLPEYAVDLYFAWKAGRDPAYTAYAAANMTGANRLLIGVGWPVLLGILWWKTRRAELNVGKELTPELAALLAATLYSFVIPLKGTFSWIDAVIFLAIFIAYLRRAAHATHVEPELTGPARHLARLPVGLRRGVTGALFLVAGGAILLAAEPFAEGILDVGRRFHVEEFLLVQWLAPLASEFPEFLVAVLFVLHRKTGAGFGTLISSKVNQWTLLVGMLPVAYSLGAHRLQPMPLDGRQIEEMVLTSAQSLFAVTILADFQFSWKDAWLLFVPFIVQLSLPSPVIRWSCSAWYFAAFLVLCSQRRRRRSLLALCRALLRPAESA